MHIYLIQLIADFSDRSTLAALVASSGLRSSLLGVRARSKEWALNPLAHKTAEMSVRHPSSTIAEGRCGALLFIANTTQARRCQALHSGMT